MKKIHFKFMGGATILCLIGWWLSGSSFQRNGVAVVWYIIGLIILLFSWMMAEVVIENHEEKKSPEIMNDPDLISNQMDTRLSGIEIRVAAIEGKISALSLVSGLRPKPPVARSQE